MDKNEICREIDSHSESAFSHPCMTSGNAGNSDPPSLVTTVCRSTENPVI